MNKTNLRNERIQEELEKAQEAVRALSSAHLVKLSQLHPDAVWTYTRRYDYLEHRYVPTIEGDIYLDKIDQHEGDLTDVCTSCTDKTKDVDCVFYDRTVRGVRFVITIHAWQMLTPDEIDILIAIGKIVTEVETTPARTRSRTYLACAV